MATESGAEENHGSEPRVKIYPLNSRRLMAGTIGRIAAALGLPKATQADSQQMIEGTLSESREPWSVQVDLVEADGATTVRLRDAEGVFLEVPPTCSEEGEEPVSPRAIDGGLSADGSRGGSPRESEAEVATAVAALDAVRTRVSDLESRLEEADRRNSDVEEEVRELKENLRRERDVPILPHWLSSCLQLGRRRERRNRSSSHGNQHRRCIPQKTKNAKNALRFTARSSKTATQYAREWCHSALKVPMG